MAAGDQRPQLESLAQRESFPVRRFGVLEIGRLPARMEFAEQPERFGLHAWLAVGA